MDVVFIEGLELAAVIGIHDWERQAKQPLVLDLEIATDVPAAARRDRIEAALDYAAVAERLGAFVGASEFQLVETLAEACAQLLHREFGIHWLRLRLGKPQAIKAARSVGVIIERSW